MRLEPLFILGHHFPPVPPPPPIIPPLGCFIYCGGDVVNSYCNVNNKHSDNKITKKFYLGLETATSRAPTPRIPTLSFRFRATTV